MNRRTIGAAILGLSLAVAPVGAQSADTTVKKEPLFTRSDAWISGGLAVGIVVFYQYDEKIALWSQSPQGQSSLSTGMANFGNWWGGAGPLIVSLGAYGAGRITGSRDWSELGLRATEAFLVSGAITGIFKGVLGRQRPYVDINDHTNFQFGKGFSDGAYTSMPSGHTTVAFAFAASVTDETAHFWPKQTWWVATVTYGAAVVTGYSRIHANKHWSSDVVAGALVGTMSGLAVNRWHRGHPNSKLDRWLLPKTVAPSKSGVAMTWSVSF